jgi:uncharacterized membrane protein YccC
VKFARYLPDLEGWLFSGKSFLAAMLALAIAFAANLDRPYWAMATVYIVVNPLSGAVRSKAVYRLVGTLIGAAMTVVLVPNLDDAPVLLSLALAGWIGACLFVSVLDRTPRGYAFNLAGYTTALIGFPVVDTPLLVWDTAVARVEEIALGIICATFVGTIIFPRPVGPVLSARLSRWLRDAHVLVLDAFTAAPSTDPAIAQARLRLAADAVDIRTVVTHLAYDTSPLSGATRLVSGLAQRMVVLIPLTATLHDRIADLRAAGGLTPELEALLADTLAWVEAEQAGLRNTPALRQRIAAAQDVADEKTDSWAGMLTVAVLTRLRELVDLRDDCRVLERHILSGRPRRTCPPLAFQMPDHVPLYQDHAMALVRAVSTMATLLAVCAFWIWTAWPDGGLAAELAAIACCFTAQRDDPVPSINALLVAVGLSALFCGAGQFIVLPAATNFEMLSLALGAFFLPAGVLAVNPMTQKLAVLPVFTATLLALEGTYGADFPSWANSTVAALFGVAAASVVTALVVPSGAMWVLQRRIRSTWVDLAAAASATTPPERLQLIGRFLDRIGLLAPQIAVGGPEEQALAVGTMTGLRVGISLVDLSARLGSMPPALGLAVAAVERRAAAFYAERVAKGGLTPPPETLLRAVDDAMDATTEATGGLRRDAVIALIALRRTLFPDAAPYQRAVAVEEGHTA